MKKIFIVFFSLLLVSVHCFAAEFIILPSIGYSNLSYGMRSWSFSVGSTQQAYGDSTFSLNSMDVGISLGFITKSSGFTFIANNDFSVIGKGSTILDGSDSHGNSLTKTFDIKNPFAWEMSIVLGRTFKLYDDKFYLNVGAGPAVGMKVFSIYMENAGKKEKLKDVGINSGVRIQLGTQYFFSEKIGISLILADTLAIAYSESADGYVRAINDYLKLAYKTGFENIFTIKTGVMFRF